MAYGDLSLDAPCKPNKGLEGGACNRRSCQAEPALWYNHGSAAWYCEDCKRDIGEDHVNRMGWYLSEHFPGHPQFETREQMDTRAREAKEIQEILDKEEQSRIYGTRPNLVILDDISPLPYGKLRQPNKPQSPSLQRLLRKPKRIKL